MAFARKAAIGFGVAVLAGGAGIAIGVAAVSDERPSGTVGAGADRLARELEASVSVDRWKQTGAVAWSFKGTRHHLWDKERNFVRVKTDDRTVWLDLASRRGVARVDGVKLAGEELAHALEDAYAAWANDSFWLNPLAKLFDEGVTRELVDGDRLLVTYGSGGVTPGDSYLWQRPGPDKRPTSWRMWVSIIPVGGVEFSWERWRELATGAWVSTLHRSKLKDLELTGIRAARRLAELKEESGAFDELAKVVAR